VRRALNSQKRRFPAWADAPHDIAVCLNDFSIGETAPHGCWIGMSDVSDGGQTAGDRFTWSDKVRKTPSWPRSWANFSLLSLYSHRNAWANLHLSGQLNTFPA
jgi:hypothetical protein